MKKNLVLGLGSNLGNRYAYLQIAIKLIEQQFETASIKAKVYSTPPWGNTNQAAFLNTAVLVQTDFEAEKCFKIIKQIEQEVGRVRSEHWGPRCIDIDILFYDSLVVENEQLSIPHPQIQNRSFVLVPLNDIVPELTHPVLQKSVSKLCKLVPNDCVIFN